MKENTIMDRLDRIEASIERLAQQHEAELHEIRELFKEMLKRHDDSHRMHETWLLDHDYVLREVTAAIRALTAAQQNTEHTLQVLIDSLRSGNGRK